MSKTTNLKSALAVAAVALATHASAQWQLYDSTPYGTVVDVPKLVIDDSGMDRWFHYNSPTGYSPVYIGVARYRTDSRWCPGWQNMTGLSWYSCLTAVIPASDTADKTGATDDQSVTDIHNFDNYFNGPDGGWYDLHVGPSGLLKWTANYKAEIAYQKFKPGPPPNPSPYNYTRSRRKETFNDYTFQAGPMSGTSRP